MLPQLPTPTLTPRRHNKKDLLTILLCPLLGLPVPAGGSPPISSVAAQCLSPLRYFASQHSGAASPMTQGRFPGDPEPCWKAASLGPRSFAIISFVSQRQQLPWASGAWQGRKMIGSEEVPLVRQGGCSAAAPLPPTPPHFPRALLPAFQAQQYDNEISKNAPTHPTSIYRQFLSGFLQG